MSEEALQNWSRATFLAQNEIAAGNLSEAKEHYIDAFNVSLSLRDSAPVSYAHTNVALAALSLLQDDPESSIAFLTDALPIYARVYPTAHYKMLELYHLIANAHHRAGLYADARHWYELTLENMAHLPWDHVDKQTVAENFRQLLQCLDCAA